MKSFGFAGMMIGGLAAAAIGFASPAIAQPTSVGDPVAGNSHHAKVVNVFEPTPHANGHGLTNAMPARQSAQRVMN